MSPTTARAPDAEGRDLNLQVQEPPERGARTAVTAPIGSRAHPC